MEIEKIENEEDFNKVLQRIDESVYVACSEAYEHVKLLLAQVIHELFTLQQYLFGSRSCR